LAATLERATFIASLDIVSRFLGEGTRLDRPVAVSSNG
jgi:hypothetical protein